MAQEVGLSCLGLSGGPLGPCPNADLCRYHGWKRTYLECRILVTFFRVRVNYLRREGCYGGDPHRDVV
jgi:hypothetical protein